MTSLDVILRWRGEPFGQPVAWSDATAEFDGACMETFVPGLELARAFYTEAVRPILREQLPCLEYAAALIGTGSEVLGFDSQRSTDHHWGPRVMLFASDEHAHKYGDDAREQLATRLPPSFRGVSTTSARPTTRASGCSNPPTARRSPTASRWSRFRRTSTTCSASTRATACRRPIGSSRLPSDCSK
ncbi:MAG: hypothetical protein WEB52_05525 [Dehalococcoidia bacterium]